MCVRYREQPQRAQPQPYYEHSADTTSKRPKDLYMNLERTKTNRPRKQQKRPLLDFGGCKPAEGKRVGLPGGGGGLTPAPPVCFYSHLHCTSPPPPPPPSLVCNCAGYFFWTQDVVKVKTFISIVVSPAFSVCLFNRIEQLLVHAGSMILILRILFQRGQVYPQPLKITPSGHSLSLQLLVHAGSMILILRILFQRGQVYPQPLNYPKWAKSSLQVFAGSLFQPPPRLRLSVAVAVGPSPDSASAGVARESL